MCRIRRRCVCVRASPPRASGTTTLRLPRYVDPGQGAWQGIPAADRLARYTHCVGLRGVWPAQAPEPGADVTGQSASYAPSACDNLVAARWANRAPRACSLRSRYAPRCVDTRLRVHSPVTRLNPPKALASGIDDRRPTPCTRDMLRGPTATLRVTSLNPRESIVVYAFCQRLW